MAVKLIKFNDGKKDEINYNEDFLSVLGVLNRTSEEYQCLEEHYNTVAYIYKTKDMYTLYFTVEKEPMDDRDNIDGYIIESTSLEELFKYAEKKRGNTYTADELKETYKSK